MHQANMCQALCMCYLIQCMHHPYETNTIANSILQMGRQAQKGLLLVQGHMSSQCVARI